MAVIGTRLQCQIQQSNILTANDSSIPKLYRPALFVPIKKSSARKWSSPNCTLQISQPSEVLELPNTTYSPRKSSAVVPTKVQTTLRNKGWTDPMGRRDQRLVSHLNTLATIASDRTEMHAILATQRDNWNRLFHSTITIASVSAATAAALNGAEQALGLSVVASFLGLGAAALMALVNKFQPSQLAEEQRHAARFFKRLTVEIEATLETDPCLCEEASHYWEQKVGTLHALDSAFPLPLTPVVLERFPKVVHPSILSSPQPDLATPLVMTSSAQYTNGWTPAAEQDLKRASQLLHKSDIPAYVHMAQNVSHFNKNLAMASPLLAVSGAICSILGAMQGTHLCCLGAALTVGALFVHSTSHAVQLGAVVETYRNFAGYYADVETSIETALRLPVDQREDGTLFLQKISMQLGRSLAESHLIPSDQEKAGHLF